MSNINILVTFSGIQKTKTEFFSTAVLIHVPCILLPVIFLWPGVRGVRSYALINFEVFRKKKMGGSSPWKTIGILSIRSSL